MSGKILSFPGYNKRSKCFLNNYHTLGTLLSALSELFHLVFTIILWRLLLSPPYQGGNRGPGNLTCPRSPSWLTKQSHSRACVVNLCAYSLSAKISGMQLVFRESFSSRIVMSHLQKCWQRCAEQWKRKVREIKFSEWVNLSTLAIFTATPTAVRKGIIGQHILAWPPLVPLACFGGTK